MMAELRAILSRFHDRRFILYVLASAVALVADVGSFLALMALGVVPAIASGIGYSLGILAHWMISSRAVFQDSVAERGSARTKQKALFVISALIGLGLTTAIVGGADLAGLDPKFAKLVAIVISFAATWLLRSHIVFRGEARRPQG